MRLSRPFCFGVVLPDDVEVITRILRPQAAQLTEYLDALEGSVEVTLRAMSVEEHALREVLAAYPELAPRGGDDRPARRGGGAASLVHESKIELGRRLAAAIQELQQRDARWIIDTLAPTVRDIRVSRPLRDLMALNASFLVDRAKLKKFDRRLAELQSQAAPRLQFDCIGPVAPFSFVELKL